MSDAARRPGSGGIAPLLRAVQRLELVARRNAAGWLVGDYCTSIPGQGLVFHESRRYVAGEPLLNVVDMRAGY